MHALRPGDLAVSTPREELSIRAVPDGPTWSGHLRPATRVLVVASLSIRVQARSGRMIDETWLLVTGAGCLGWIQWGLERA